MNQFQTCECMGYSWTGLLDWITGLTHELTIIHTLHVRKTEFIGEDASA